MHRDLLLRIRVVAELAQASAASCFVVVIFMGFNFCLVMRSRFLWLGPGFCAECQLVLLIEQLVQARAKSIQWSN